MKSKILSSVLLSLILSVMIVSAATFTASKTSLDFVRPSTSVNFTLNTPSTTTSSYELVMPTITDVDGNSISLTPSGNLQNINTPQVITLTSSVDYTKLRIDQTYTGSLIVKNTANATDTITLPVKYTSTFCKSGEVGNSLDISEVSINNNDGDDTEWTPLDKITIDFTVENNGDSTVKKINVELGFFDAKGKNIVNNLDNLDSKTISLGSISSGKDKSETYTFNVPTDIEEDTYYIVIKTFSTDLGEKEECTSSVGDFDSDFYQSIDGARETDTAKQIIVSNIRLSPDVAQCNDKVQLSADVTNIGDEDYSDQVKVTLVNTELGVKEEKVITEDFNQGDSASVDFDFDIPANAKEKSYTFEMRTFYDYNTKSDTYRITSSSKFTNFDQPFKVEGNCASTPTTPTNNTNTGANVQINAQIDPSTPDAVAGEQLVIKATVKNTGDSDSTYTLSTVGNNGWSNLVSIEPQTFTLAKGASKDVTIALALDKAAVGDKEFTIRANYGTKTTDYKVQLAVTQPAVSSDVVIEHLKQNWFIYVIVLVNVVLILAIIMVVRRMLRPRPASM